MRRVIYFLVPIICFLITTTFAQSPPPVSFAAVVNYAVGTNPHSLALADFNGDGRPDLATANLNSNDVSVLLSNGDGTFQAAVNYAVGSFPHSVTVGDFDGDGKPDLATANENSANA